MFLDPDQTEADVIPAVDVILIIGGNNEDSSLQCLDPECVSAKKRNVRLV